MAASLDGIDERFFEHGGRLDLARELFPHAPEPWIDLSTGISPWSCPVPQLPAEALQRLPDATALHRLQEIARKAYRAPAAAEVVALPGTDTGLSVLPWLFREPKRVAVLAPCYSGHAAAWTAAGHSVRQIDSLDDAGSAAIVIAVNPNNPDGRFLPLSELAAATASLKRRDGLLIVDEAFADAEESHSLLPHVARLDRTLVLRSAGKFFGAAGVRLGFAITSHPVAARLKAALGAWPIPAQTLAFGIAALADAAWAEAQRKRLGETVAGLDALLTGAGLRVLGGTALFKLVSHPEAHSLFAHLAGKGILTRPFKDRAALRFGLPPGPEEMARLGDALQNAPKG
jgi:cobalamin biosynthetic protein CobC